MKRMARLLHWLLTPSLLHGLALGVAGSLLVAMTWQLAVARTVAVALLAGCFLLLLGLLVGTSLIRKQWETLRRSSLLPIQNTAQGLIAALASTDAEERNTKLAELVPVLTRQAGELGETAASLLLRFLAAGRLFALLGVTVSFAVFLATYMQVERLAEQNSLVRLQALSAHQQVALSVRSEISSVASLHTLASELLSIYRKQDSLYDELNRVCGQARANLREAPTLLLRLRLDTDSPDLQCVQKIVEMHRNREDNLQANRLLNQQVTGSGLRLNVFTRDLTEQFTTQFSSICGTSASRTSDIGRQWAASNDLGDAATSFLEAVADPKKDSIVHLSGTPDQNLKREIDKYLQLTGHTAKNIGELGASVLAVYRSTREYLEAQKSACYDRELGLRRNLESLDKKYEALLDAEVLQK